MKHRISTHIVNSITEKRQAQTYLFGYGISPSYRNINSVEKFVQQSKLTVGKWIKNSNGTDVELGGYWRNPNPSSTIGNYFVVETINKQTVEPDNIEHILLDLTKKFMQKENPLYSEGFICFAGNPDRGIQFPILSRKQEEKISANENIFDQAHTLRYAFASSIAYSRELKEYPFQNNEYYKALMLHDNKLDIVDEIRGGNHGVWAVAIRVPHIHETSLKEEIIIAYKGTSNGMDKWNDVKLCVQNFIEKNAGWQNEAYDFCKKIIDSCPPNKNSVQEGYNLHEAGGSHNIVLTGHSLGGYAAIQVAARTGIVSRVFSSPATKIINEYVNLFDNSLYYNNCVNFVRDMDPVVEFSGRHSENMVYYPSANGINPFNSHSLEPFIENILLPSVTKTSLQRGLSPTHLYINPNIVLGAGIEKSVNVWK